MSAISRWVCLLVLLAVTACGAPGLNCDLVKVTSMPLETREKLLVVPVGIGGKFPRRACQIANLHQKQSAQIQESQVLVFARAQGELPSIQNDSQIGSTRGFHQGEGCLKVVHPRARGAKLQRQALSMALRPSGGLR